MAAHTQCLYDPGALSVASVTALWLGCWHCWHLRIDSCLGCIWLLESPVSHPQVLIQPSLFLSLTSYFSPRRSLEFPAALLPQPSLSLILSPPPLCLHHSLLIFLSVTGSSHSISEKQKPRKGHLREASN